jgi:glycosyltransferase involved in cell wall biosynthesis
MVPLTIVIPNGRIFPSALVAALTSQTLEGDEIRVVQNHRTHAARHWAGVGAGDSAPAPAEHPGVRVLASALGAAAARNVGWRTAANEWVVFVDDDVEVPATFLADVRERLVERSTPRVLTFRVLSTSSDPSIATLSAFVPFDRGPDVFRSPAAPVPLNEAWRYGVGAALAAHRSVLEATGGFKEALGAGRRNGGSEDLELFWHASRHAEVEYRGDIAVEHRPVESVRVQLLKYRQYGRAVAALAGTAKGWDGLRSTFDFCRHMARLTSWSRQASLSGGLLRQVRIVTTLAIAEAARVYVLSLLLRRRRGVRCPQCRRWKVEGA